ncbi:MAG: TonB-dependent receptor [Crocinitomicaceae bacterium]|nr:TonB-dependent receptor [Crocinitomicaceae bacterium]
MRHLLSLTLFLIVCQLSYAQEIGGVKGKILGQEGPIEFATVMVKSTSDSSLVKAGYTDSLGNYSLMGILPGNYYLSAKAMGQMQYNSEPFDLENSIIEMASIEMEPNQEVMDVVTVTQIRPIVEVQPDRTVFNVANTVNSTGSNGFDLLRKAPGVIIDNNNNIILEGKSGVQFYIDNKASYLAGEDMINFLKSLQASDIDKIEIITQPSSKYDAAGNAGIINIILKRDQSIGTNGSLNAGYSYGWNHRYNGGLSLNHRTKKFNIYGMYSGNGGNSGMFMIFERNQNDVNYNQRTDNLWNRQGNNAKVGVDFFANDKHTFGFLATGYYQSTDGTTESITNIFADSVNYIQQKLVSENNTEGRNYQVAGNLNYRFADTLGHELTIDLDYAVYDRIADAFQPNIYQDGQLGTELFSNIYRMNTPTSIDIATAKMDYSQNLFKGKFSAGVKYSLVTTDNNFEFFDVIGGEDILNTDRSNQFVYSENINAGYINYAQNLNRKWSIQGGLRYEYTISQGILTSTQENELDRVKRTYGNLFPSGGITFVPNMMNMFSLTYSRRIQRPNYQSLNPFVSQSDELSFRQGNPFLQPQYTDNFKLSHTFAYRFTTSISYSHISDFSAEVTDTLGFDRSFITTRNVADQDIISFGLSIPLTINKWWNVYVGIDAFYAKYTANDEKFTELTQQTVSGFAQSSFLLKGGFKLEFSGWFSSPSVWGGTYVTQSMGSLNIALEKKFFEDRLVLRAAMQDVFFTSPWRADMTYGDLYIWGTGGWESRQFAFNVNYNFGSKTIKGSRNRKTGLEEEDGRTGGGQ